MSLFNMVRLTMFITGVGFFLKALYGLLALFGFNRYAVIFIGVLIFSGMLKTIQFQAFQSATRNGTRE